MRRQSLADRMPMRESVGSEVLALPRAARIVTVAVTALLAGLVLLRFGWAPETPSFLVLPLFGVVLAMIDLRTRLLPNALLLPFAATTLVLLLASSGLSGDWNRLAGAALGGVAMFGIYLVLALVSPGSLGMGDVKLAAVLGLYGGYAGMTTWLATLLGGFLIGGLISVFLLLFTKASARSVFPFGPPMLAACFAAIVAFG
ncbi:prepilin peptidase [Arthrobacter sp. Sr33]|uniref:prepilin peptidase n=1 Tax=Arthrobacter sp. TB 23 TaxID=494419 RepID=UPI00030AB068|nr:A24 family peptidase [Arthrobacter sp. TB 23]